MKRDMKILAAAVAAVTAVSCASTTVFAELKTVYGEEYVKSAVDFYSGMNRDDPDDWEAFDDLTAINGGRFTYFFNDELSDFRNVNNKLIKVNCTIDPGLEEKKADIYEWLKKDFDFCFFTDDNKEYYYSFDISERTAFTLKEVVEKSGVDAEKIAIAMLKCPPGDMDFTLDGVKTVDCQKGWYTLDGERYYVKKNGMLAAGLNCIGGIEYKFDKNGVCRGKYTGWAKTSKGRVYYKNGVKLKNRWLRVNGVRTYYFKENGVMAVGDLQLGNGRTYHFEADGKLGRAPLIFAAVETNKAWGFYQNVVVLDSAGNIYFSGVYEDETKEITFMEDDWYDKLIKTASSLSNKTVSGKLLKKIGAFLNDAGKYGSSDKKVYEYDDGDDGGTTAIYGIYKDADGKTKFIEICRYGDIYKCIDDETVESFVNSLIYEDEMSSFFYGCAGYNE